MASPKPDRWRRGFLSLRPLSWMVFAAGAAYYISFSIHWKLMIDSPIMHYVVFLMHHGLRPYIDISDNNMPGAYLTEAAAMRIFGAGDLGWRLYEYFLLAVMAGSMIWMARGRDWVAGVFGAGMFLALHASEGPQSAGERELVVTVLLLLSCVALFAAVEKRRPWLAFILGLASGLAVSIKPTYLLFALVLLAAMVVVLRRRAERSLPYLFWALGGLAVVGLMCLGFLLRYHALAAFVFVLQDVLPSYASMSPPPWKFILAGVLPSSLRALTLLVVPLAISNWRRYGPWRWEQVVLGLGALLGLISYLAQRKGFPHHRYTLVAFLLLLLGTELYKALRSVGWPRLVASVGILYALFGFVPRMLRTGARMPNGTELYQSLRTDFQTLGGSAQLQRKVFCFDLVYGCLNVLYHDGIVENTGFTGDLLFFPQQRNAATDFYRQRFWSEVRRDPPAVLVVSNEDLMTSNSFERLKRWPELEAYLDQNYTELVERHFKQDKFGVHHDDSLRPEDEDAYRIYVRRDSPLLSKGAELARTQ